jgi:hypothetical protein
MPALNLNSRNIEMLLTTNSDLHLKKVHGTVPVMTDFQNEYRPDRIFGADQYMKISMIAAGIDSPWMLVRGRVIPRPDPLSLNREFVAMDEDFKI